MAILCGEVVDEVEEDLRGDDLARVDGGSEEHLRFFLLLEIGVVGELDRPDFAPLHRAADGGEVHDVGIALGEGGEFVAQLLPGVIGPHIAAQGGFAFGQGSGRAERLQPEAFILQTGLFGGGEDRVDECPAAA
ncbi:MAG: hypothetical protein BWY77_01437 [bacterium ADurb.Bin431]|nr:MAG: hypothetical protein BWY77_01437 [bacterium ADurb.Bin431]